MDGSAGVGEGQPRHPETNEEVKTHITIGFSVDTKELLEALFLQMSKLFGVPKEYFDE